jgi:hypothetical protein
VKITENYSQNFENTIVSSEYLTHLHRTYAFKLSVWHRKYNFHVLSTPWHDKFLFGLLSRQLPIPVTAWSKAWVCGSSRAGIVGSNPAEGMDVGLF